MDDFEVKYENKPTIIETAKHFGVFWRKLDRDIKLTGSRKPDGEFVLNVTITLKIITLDSLKDAVETKINYMTAEFMQQIEDLSPAMPIFFQLPMPTDVIHNRYQSVDTFEVKGLVFERIGHDGVDEISFD